MAKGLKNPLECANVVRSKKWNNILSRLNMCLNLRTDHHLSIYLWCLISRCKTRLLFYKGFGMCVASVQTNVTSPNALITPSSLTHACSTSAESELCLFTSVPVGQVCSKKPWTTSTDTHSLGSLSCPPIKGVYHRLPHDVIPSPSAKLITTLYPGMCVCVHVDVCVKDSTCQSKPLSLMNPELEWGTIKQAACAAKGQSHKRLWWILFFLSPFNSAVTYQSSENHQVAGGTQGGVEDLPVKSAQNVGLTASWQIEIKVKQRSSVFFFYITSYLIFQRKGSWLYVGWNIFFYLIDSLNVNGMATVQK